MKKVLVIFLCAFILRIGVLFVAYHGDLNNNISWGTLAFERGLSGFYEGGGWPYSAPNQPPITILMFAGSMGLWQEVENTSWRLNSDFPIFPSAFVWFWEERGKTLLVKLPSVLADLGIAWLIFNYLGRRKKKIAVVLTTVWLFNPLVWYNSSIWGQTDSIVNFLGLFGILFLLQRKLILFVTFLTLSLLFKGSLAFFIPVLLVVAIWQKYRIKEWAKASLGAVGVVILVSIWFHPAPDLLIWLVDLYSKRIFPGEVGYLTANAFNFWWLVDSGRTLDSMIYLMLSAHIWGFILVILGMGIVLFRLRKKLNEPMILFSLALVALWVFLFLTRVHERYLYPFFPVGTLILGFFPKVWVPFVILSVVHLLNLYHLFWAPSFAPLEALYLSGFFQKLLSVVSILAFLWLAFLYWRPSQTR